MQLKPSSLIRPVTVLATSVATYNVTKATIRNNVAEPQTKTQKVTLWLGSFVIASMVSESAESYVNGKFDDFAHEWSKIKQQTPTK